MLAKMDAQLACATNPERSVCLLFKASLACGPICTLLAGPPRHVRETPVPWDRGAAKEEAIMAGTIILTASNRCAEQELEKKKAHAENPPDWRGDPGLDCIANVYGSALSVDRTWALCSDRGFAWWAHRHRQMLWADTGFDDEGMSIFRLSSVTEVATLAETVGTQDTATLDILDMLNAEGSGTGAYVLEEGTLRLRFWTSLYVHEGTAVWVAGDFGAFAIMGLIDVEGRAGGLARDLGAAEAIATHPLSGPRDVSDETLEIGVRLIKPEGRGVNRWFFPEVLMPVMETFRSQGLGVDFEDRGFSVRLEEGDLGPRLAVECLAHPAWGGGCALSLDLGESLILEDCLRRVAALNLYETTECSRSHLAGAWMASRDKEGGRASVVFRSFLPNILFAEGKLLNYAMGLAIKARWAAGLARRWDFLARAGYRPRCEGFPESLVEPTGGYMGDASVEPGEVSILLCEADSSDSGVMEVAEHFQLEILGEGPWVYRLHGSSEYGKSSFLARVEWDRLDPLGGGLKLWSTWLKGRNPSFICPLRVGPGPFLEVPEVEEAFEEVKAEWDWIFHPRSYPERFLAVAAKWIPLLDAARALRGIVAYTPPRAIEALPEDSTKIGAVEEPPEGMDLSCYHYCVESDRILIFREYLHRKRRGSMGLFFPYKKDYFAIGELALEASDEVARHAFLGFLRLRSEGRIRSVEFGEALSPNALDWIMGDEGIMESCRKLAAGG